MVSPPHFDHEKLDVYQLELKFLSWVTEFLADLSSRSLAPTRELREQLDRASLSAPKAMGEDRDASEPNSLYAIRARGRARARLIREAKLFSENPRRKARF